jgi:hypothetical protein
VFVREKQKVQLSRDNSETQTRTKHNTEQLVEQHGSRPNTGGQWKCPSMVSSSCLIFIAPDIKKKLFTNSTIAILQEIKTYYNYEL